MRKRLSLLAPVLLAAVLAASSSSQAAPLQLAANRVAMTTGAAIMPPGGVIGFCIKNLRECMSVPQQPTVVELTADRQRDLEDVQKTVNADIHPRENATHAWAYASAGYGDCNSYALEKRRALIARGWPQTALLLASATTETDEGHLVLIVRTSAGDLALDNRLAPVVDWTRLPYRWISLQSEQRFTIWHSIVPRSILTSDARPAPTPVR